ncbi:hypothetical protein [Novosphingobium ginsenosidimutans]|uniref:Uncharacterized protein n=1 Tax=Novosphingobium ginsenosidimutans TaxID=1176536 RepID=A0A5B8S5A6_9SPHN|nr:hypothetical protein [Novosphingobium ginsenosidimutans]QEA16384.1 hypothetical protein FRF71_09705 [Novosphingobium ginsenosidimutans]
MASDEQSKQNPQETAKTGPVGAKAEAGQTKQAAAQSVVQQDDDDRRYRSRSRDDEDDRGRGRGGWFGDSRGHSEAARRGWEDRR